MNLFSEVHVRSAVSCCFQDLRSSTTSIRQLRKCSHDFWTHMGGAYHFQGQFRIAPSGSLSLDRGETLYLAAICELVDLAAIQTNFDHGETSSRAARAIRSLAAIHAEERCHPRCC